MRLLACAFTRLSWDRFPDDRSRQCVEVLEQFADGACPEQVLNEARRILSQLAQQNSANSLNQRGQYAPASWAIRRAVCTAQAAGFTDPRRAADMAIASSHEGTVDSTIQHHAVIAEILGPQFLPKVAPAWLVWNDGTVRKLAQTVYDDRRYDLLPILADALEEAGCGNADMLAHCRGPGPHVRGCWVVDLLLGKE
jgi:hypothetical protein